MDYDKKTLEIIQEMRDQMEEFGDSVDKVEDQLVSLKNQLKQVNKEEEKTENTGQQIGSQMSTIGSIGSSAVKTVGDLVKNIGGQALKAVPVIGNLFSILEIGGDIISAIAGGFSAQPVVSQVQVIKDEYKNMREEIGAEAAIELYRVEHVDTLIDRMEDLQGQTSLTKDEQREYNNLVATLEEELPDVTGLLKDQNQKYSNQLDLLRNINQEQSYAMIDETISEAEDAALQEVGKQRDNYAKAQGKVDSLQEDLDKTIIGSVIKTIREKLTEQIRKKYNLSPGQELTEGQQGKIDQVIGVFEKSATMDKFLESDIWQQVGLDNSEIKQDYDANGATYNVAFNNPGASDDYKGTKNLLVQAQEDADEAYQGYKDALFAYDNKTYLKDVFTGLLSGYKVIAEREGAENVEIDEALLDRMAMYGYSVNEDFEAEAGADPLDRYRGKSSSQILMDSLSSSESQSALEFLNGFYNFDTLSDYINDPNSVTQQEINDAMLGLKPYLPEGVDINSPQNLTEDTINSMWSQYLQDNEEFLTLLYENAVSTQGILEQIGSEDEINAWQTNVIDPLYTWLEKEPKVTFKLSGGLLKTLGLVEEEEDNNTLGTPYYGGGRTWVGEHGPELLDLPRESSYAGTNAGNVIITGNTVHVAEKPDIEQITAELVAKLEETLFNMP